MDFLNNEKGQVAIYDAVNPLSSGRKALEREFAKQDVQVTSICSSASEERPLITI